MKKHTSKRRVMLYDAADSLYKLGYTVTGCGRTSTGVQLYIQLQLALNLCQTLTGLTRKHTEDRLKYAYRQYLHNISVHHIPLKADTIESLLAIAADTDKTLVCPSCGCDLAEYAREHSSDLFTVQPDFWAGVPEDRRPPLPTKSPTKQ